MSIIHYNDIKSPILQAAIVEPILIFCIKGSSIFEISCNIQSMLTIPYAIIKNYLFYLIDFEAISYNGQKKIFKISDGGLDLLYMIDKEKKQAKTDIKDITITFECE